MKFRLFKDLSKYPRFSFTLDFYRDLITIAFINVGLRLLHYFVSWTNKMLPLESTPEEIRSYLPVKILRLIVTVFDAVSFLSILVIAIFTVIKAVKSHSNH